jgi:hypothetical protein
MAGLLPAALPLLAQSPEMQQKVYDVKQSLAWNKQALAQYTWTEQDIISINGEEKKEEMFNVRLGPDGRDQKTPVDPNSMSDDERHRHGLRARVKEKKIDEYKEYADAIKALIKQYVPPDPEKLQQLYHQGNIMIGPEGGSPDQYKLVISNYLKPGDSVTVVMSKSQKALVMVSIATYLSDPSDAVKMDVLFSQLPGGPNHVATGTVNGVSKHLTIVVQNSNYQHM